MEIGFEVIKILLLIVVSTEGALLLYKKEDKPEEERRNSRRDIYGTFSNPLGDTYRRNSKGQLTPVHPNDRIRDLQGDEDDEV